MSQETAKRLEAKKIQDKKNEERLNLTQTELDAEESARKIKRDEAATKEAEKKLNTQSANMATNSRNITLPENNTANLKAQLLQASQTNKTSAATGKPQLLDRPLTESEQVLTAQLVQEAPEAIVQQAKKQTISNTLAAENVSQITTPELINTQKEIATTNSANLLQDGHGTTIYLSDPLETRNIPGGIVQDRIKQLFNQEKTGAELRKIQEAKEAEKTANEKAKLRAEETKKLALEKQKEELLLAGSAAAKATLVKAKRQAEAERQSKEEADRKTKENSAQNQSQITPRATAVLGSVKDLAAEMDAKNAQSQQHGSTTNNATLNTLRTPQQSDPRANDISANQERLKKEMDALPPRMSSVRELAAAENTRRQQNNILNPNPLGTPQQPRNPAQPSYTSDIETINASQNADQTTHRFIPNLERLQHEVREHPHLLKHDAPQNQEHVTKVKYMQSIAGLVSRDHEPLKDTDPKEFTPLGNNTWTCPEVMNDLNFTGPIVMSRFGKDRKPIKGVVDIVYYEKGVRKLEKSFMAPDDVPEGSKSSVDPKTRGEYVKVHKELDEKKQIQDIASPTKSLIHHDITTPTYSRPPAPPFPKSHHPNTR